MIQWTSTIYSKEEELNHLSMHLFKLLVCDRKTAIVFERPQDCVAEIEEWFVVQRYKRENSLTKT